MVANAKISARWLYDLFSATSGAMYRNEPVLPVSGRHSRPSSPSETRHSLPRPKSNERERAFASVELSAAEGKAALNSDAVGELGGAGRGADRVRQRLGAREADGQDERPTCQAARHACFFLSPLGTARGGGRRSLLFWTSFCGRPVGYDCPLRFAALESQSQLVTYGCTIVGTYGTLFVWW